MRDWRIYFPRVKMFPKFHRNVISPNDRSDISNEKMSGPSDLRHNKFGRLFVEACHIILSLF